MNRSDFEDMIANVEQLHQEALDLSRREDWVRWSQESEDNAWKKYRDALDEVLDLMELGANQED